MSSKTAIATAQFVALADQATAEATLEISSLFTLLSIQVTRPCRIRLYGNRLQLLADAARPYTLDPLRGSGLIAEFLMVDSMMKQGIASLNTSPLVIGHSQDQKIYMAVQNISGQSGNLDVAVTYQPGAVIRQRKEVLNATA